VIHKIKTRAGEPRIWKSVQKYCADNCLPGLQKSAVLCGSCDVKFKLCWRGTNEIRSSGVKTPGFIRKVNKNEPKPRCRKSRARRNCGNFENEQVDGEPNVSLRENVDVQEPQINLPRCETDSSPLFSNPEGWDESMSQASTLFSESNISSDGENQHELDGDSENEDENETLFTLNGDESVFLNLQTVKSSSTKCFICKKIIDGKRCVVPREAAADLFLSKKIYLPREKIRYLKLLKG
jgi:hypothetical protein